MPPEQALRHPPRATRALVMGAFDAEALWRPNELARLPSFNAARATTTILASDQLLAVLCGPNDALLTRYSLDPALLEHFAELGWQFFHRAALPIDAEDPNLFRALRGQPALASWVSSLQLRAAKPYAVVPEVQELFAEIGISAPLPALDVVCRINSKSFSTNLRTDLNLLNPAIIVEDLETLRRAVGALLERGAVLIKDPYGVSGTGAVKLRRVEELLSLLKHLQLEIDAGKRLELILEPFLSRACDFSAHVVVSQHGECEFLGLQSIANRGMRFVGSGPAPMQLHDQLIERGYFEDINRISSRIAKNGYWGPVCIDSMFLDTGELLTLVEINARYSMGRIARELQERFGGDLPCEVRVWDVRLPENIEFQDVLWVLKSSAVLLLKPGTLGVLPLASGTLQTGLFSSPSRMRGRLYLAVIADQPNMSPLLTRTVNALHRIGIEVYL